MAIVRPGRKLHFIEADTRLTQHADNWSGLVTASVNFLAFVSGNGSPEGVLEASLGKEYFDSVAADFYKKTIDGGNTGWKQIT